MQIQQQIDMIRAISMARGVSGFEDEALCEIRKFCEGLGTVKQDSINNLYLARAENTGNKPLVLLDAHSDEVGFMVQAVKPNGALSFIPIGGWVPTNVPAHEVAVRTAEGSYITGITSSKPPHFMTEAERKAPPALESMAIDIGACSAQQAKEEYGVRVGEPVVPVAPFHWQPQHGTLIGKAFDCRLGCAAQIATLQQLQGEALPCDITATFTSQEELGTRGAKVAMNKLRPDVAILFEGCPADDTFAGGEVQCGIGRGPMIRHIDASMLTNPRLMRHVLEVAHSKGIPVQQAVRSTGGTNGGAIHLAGQGVPVVVIGLPVRYIHAHQGIAKYSDYEAAVQLAAELLRGLTTEAVKGF